MTFANSSPTISYLDAFALPHRSEFNSFIEKKEKTCKIDLSESPVLGSGRSPNSHTHSRRKTLKQQSDVIFESS
jgi:hypothetical protein